MYAKRRIVSTACHGHVSVNQHVTTLSPNHLLAHVGNTTLAHSPSTTAATMLRLKTRQNLQMHMCRPPPTQFSVKTELIFAAGRPQMLQQAPCQNNKDLNMCAERFHMMTHMCCLHNITDKGKQPSAGSYAAAAVNYSEGWHHYRFDATHEHHITICAEQAAVPLHCPI
jgi:hypothetical protein